jgi:hypothetical protein
MSDRLGNPAKRRLERRLAYATFNAALPAAGASRGIAQLEFGKVLKSFREKMIAHEIYTTLITVQRENDIKEG